MITDEMVAAARRHAPKAWRETSQCDKHIRAMLRAADAAAWQPIETAPRNERIIIQTAVDTHVAKWAKNPFTDDIAYVVSRSGDEQHVIEVDKITCWRPLPACPDEG